MSERLERGDWLHLTEQLGARVSGRFPHLCGDGRVLLVSREDSGGYRAWCFRCQAGGSAPGPALSLAERLERMRQLENADAELATALPEPAVLADQLQDWPMQARLWLYKAGLGGAEIRRLGAYYHPPSNRVVLPVPGGYWQARSIDGRQPKYLGAATGRTTAVAAWGEGPTLVVTEDILSAFKVGMVTSAVAALGTSPSAAVVNHIMQFKDVRVWLDPDPAGRRGATKIISRLRAYGVSPANVVSDRDPKLLSKEQIREHLRS